MFSFSDYVDFLEGPGVRNWQFHSSGVKLINIRNIVNDNLDLSNTNNYLSENEVESKYQHFLLSVGDFVMASSGVTWGKIAEVKKMHLPLCLNTSIIKLVPRQGLEKRYLWHYIKSSVFRNQINRLITGSAQPNFGPSHLKKLKIPLPPLPIQRKIAEVLDAADRIRQRNKEVLKKYDQLAQSVFLEMFGDPVKNEKGWEVKSLGDVGALDRGISKHRPRNAPELLGGAHPLIQTGDVANSGGYIKSYKSTYSDVGLKQSRKWPIGTLCITIAANIAKTGILTFEACFPDSVVGFKPSKESTTEYVQYWLSFLQKTLEEQAPESAQKNINLKILRELSIPLPPIDLQSQFASIIERIEQQKQQAQAELEQSEALFQSLMQRAFKGDLVSS